MFGKHSWIRLVDDAKNLPYIGPAVVLMDGGWTAEKKTASTFCALSQVKHIGDKGKLSLNREWLNMLRVENFLESGVGWAEQRTEPGASFMVAQGHCIPLGQVVCGSCWSLPEGFWDCFPLWVPWTVCHGLVEEHLYKNHSGSPFLILPFFWHCHLVKIFKCTFVTQVVVAAQLV